MAYQPGVNPNTQQYPQYNSGVMPLTAEPLTDWEKQGLSGLADLNHGGMLEGAMTAYRNLVADPQAAAQKYISPTATAAVDNMGRAIGEGTRRLSGSDVERYMNPYTQQVTEATLRGISEDEARRNASLTAKQGLRGGRSFGDSSSAIQLSELARNMDTLRGSTRANLNYQGYNDAVGQFNTEQDRFLTGAGLYGDQATTSQNIFTSGLGAAGDVIGGMAELGGTYYDQRAKAMKDKIGAGSTVRNYNQNIANTIGGEISNVTNLQPNRLNELARYLDAFKPTSYAYSKEPDTLAKIGSYATGGSALIDLLGSL